MNIQTKALTLMTLILHKVNEMSASVVVPLYRIAKIIDYKLPVSIVWLVVFFYKAINVSGSLAVMDREYLIQNCSIYFNVNA